MGWSPDHKRMRPKASRPPTEAEALHHAQVRSMNCAACGSHPPVSAHHVVSDGFKRLTKDHQRVIPLCPSCHQNAPYAVHKIGHGPFNELFGIDQLALASQLWEDRPNG